MSSSSQRRVSVVVRIRPPVPRELSGGSRFRNVAAVLNESRAVTLSTGVGAGEGEEDDEGVLDEGPGGALFKRYSFGFDRVFDAHESQQRVYDDVARDAVDSTLRGYNATIMAYGQTGAGKTYTMEGAGEGGGGGEGGVMPRAFRQIFDTISASSDAGTRFLVRASYLQIYNEVVSDLLKPGQTNLQIREDKRRGVFVDGLSEWVVRTPAEIADLMRSGSELRATGTTRMNDVSSRSHAVFVIITERSQAVDCADVPNAPPGADSMQSVRVGKLNLVDLAGSERLSRSQASGQRLEESKSINKSLSALGNVIAALTQPSKSGPSRRQHVPYRDSKLTRLLEDSLGGNCITTMVALISPAQESFGESLSTLKFATRAKRIENVAHINEDLGQKALLRKYQLELKRLRAELASRSQQVVDRRRIFEMEEERRRADADRLEVFKALEERNEEYMREKQEKKLLEDKIGTLESQLLSGASVVPTGMGPSASSGGADAAVRVALQQQYENKLAELERERSELEGEKAQVGRYKQLLVKQRDIMIALTAKLRERDETILKLQEELDHYDRRQVRSLALQLSQPTSKSLTANPSQRLLEDSLDDRTAQLIHLQRVAMEKQTQGANGSPARAPASQQAGAAIGSPVRDWRLGAAEGKSFGGESDLQLLHGLESRLAGLNSQYTQFREEVQSRLEEKSCYLDFLERESTGLSALTRDAMGDAAAAAATGSELAEMRVALEAAQAERDDLKQRCERQLTRARAARRDRSREQRKEREQLQTKVQVNARESDTVKAVMETKVKVMVDRLAGGVCGEHAPDVNEWNGSTQRRVAKDVATLQRIVNAAVEALSLT